VVGDEGKREGGDEGERERGRETSPLSPSLPHSVTSGIEVQATEAGGPVLSRSHGPCHVSRALTCNLVSLSQAEVQVRAHIISYHIYLSIYLTYSHTYMYRWQDRKQRDQEAMCL
jgi:hypothetical protein